MSQIKISVRDDLRFLPFLKRKIVAYFTASLLAGTLCTLRPGYAEEAVPGQKIVLNAEEGRLITLADGINRLLKSNRLLNIAVFDKYIALEDANVARSAFFPQINASVSQTFLNHQPAAKFGAESVNTAQRESVAFEIDVYQTLFDFGKSLFLYEASTDLVSASEAKTEAVRRIAVLQFIMNYFDLLESEKMISVAEKEVESLTAYLNDITHLYEQGAAIKNDLLPAKVKLADAQQRCIAARNARITAAARMNTLLAIPLREKIRVEDISEDVSGIPVIEEARKAAQTARPEIQMVEKQLSASLLGEKAKIAESYPSVFVDGGYAYSENRYQVHQDNAFLQVGAKTNLFNGGATKAAIQKERLKYQQILEQKNKLSEDIEYEIEDSYYALKNALEKRSVSKEVLAEAAENVRVNRVKYSEGSATATEVLEAITLQTNAQTNYYAAEYDVKRSHATLMYSMGTDLAVRYDAHKKGSVEHAK